MNDELSPEIMALLAETERCIPGDPLFPASEIEEDGEFAAAGSAAGSVSVNLAVKEFAPISKFFETQADPVFSDPAYYKTALSGENESSQKLHALLSKYLTCQDPKDRSVFRQQLTTVYWEFLKSLAPKMAQNGICPHKKILMRFSLVLPSLITAEQRDTFASVVFNNYTGEPVYYLDEWLKEVSTGRITLSATDESRQPKKASGSAGASEETARLMQLNSKNTGKLQNAETLLAGKESERAMIEAELRSRVDQLCDHPPTPGMEMYKAILTDAQKRLPGEIMDRLKSLQKIDRELASLFSEYEEAKSIGESLREKLEKNPAAAEINTSDVLAELETIRQMCKMTVGRQGNHFPILTREYYHCTPRGAGFRENILDCMRRIESIDPGAFCRIHRNAQNRIVPYVLIVPTYGDTGMCWEPFDRYNRVSSRGRIVIPMYPKNLELALLTAVADLRWQVAKEKASYYWMEEGLTGQYYQWFSQQKLKGDLKDAFINDYVLWMTKESDGVQRLDKEVRGIFWRHLPFAQDIKDKLKTRSLIYQELYQRDVNRSMSDGY